MLGFPTRRCCAALAFILSVSVGNTSVVQAQPAPGLERRLGPSDTRPLEPTPLSPVPEPGLRIPEAPEAAPTPPEQAGVLRLFVTKIVLVGNTVIPSLDLAAITRQYEGRAVAVEELLQLRDALTRLYIERGYVNSGAVIPDQDVVDGVVTIRIIEGRLDDIDIQGLDMLRPGYLEDRIRLRPWPSFAQNEPLNVNDLRERLQILLNDPAIERLNARLGSGVRPSESRLEVSVEEAPRFQGELRSNNFESPSVGEYRGEARLLTRSVLGYGDPLQVYAGVTKGVRDGGFSYSLPLAPWDLRTYAIGEITRSKIVEGDFEDLDIESITMSMELGLQTPLYRDGTHDLSASLGLVRRRSQTYLDGRTFTFSSGAENGQSDITAIRFAQDWLWRALDQVAAARSTFSFGIDGLGSTVNGSAPDSRYFAWLGQAQYIRRLSDRDDQVVVRADAQLTPDSLLAIEQYAVGGGDSVRGYQENQLVRDNGWNTSLETRISLFNAPIRYLGGEPATSWVQLAPFVDAGGGWNQDGETGNAEVLYSVGTGLRWSPAPGIRASLYYGYALNDVGTTIDTDGLQDHGISFELIVQL